MLITCVPAYGRDYKSKAAVLADWEANKDFRMTGFHGEGYVNKQQTAELKRLGVVRIQFRYRKLEETFIYDLK